MPAIEVKSSFTLRRAMDINELASLAGELDTLPEASEEQRRQLAFLDNLYRVRGAQQVEQLKERLFEILRLAALNGDEPDFNIADPNDVAGFHTGSSYKLSRWTLAGDPPEIDDVLSVLREHCGQALTDPGTFAQMFASMGLSYLRGDPDDPDHVRRDAWRFVHGQVDLNGQTFFLLDADWYQVKGTYLDGLKRDFLEEVFGTTDPIFLQGDLSLSEWSQRTEGEYNAAQAGRPGFYFGDEIFAIAERGPVELFDLLKVDAEARRLYVIHVKDGFGAKMRDACSQISLSHELIAQDKKTGKTILTGYYADWSVAEQNSDVSLAEFLGWFDLEIVYVVLASTRGDFSPESFGKTLTSHIARREILTTRNEFRSSGATFKLAHTRRTRPS